MKKAAIFLMVFSAALCLFVFILYKEDMKRMDNDEPVLFSTWGHEYTPGEDVEELDELYIEFKDGTITSRGATINVVNNKSYDISFGEFYSIEEFEMGTWKELSARGSENNWNDMLYIVESGKTAEFRIYWAELYGELESGNYRLRKIYSDDYELNRTSDLYGYFKIE